MRHFFARSLAEDPDKGDGTTRKTSPSALAWSMSLGGAGWVPWSDRVAWLELWQNLWRTQAPATDLISRPAVSHVASMVNGILDQMGALTNIDWTLVEWHAQTDSDPQRALFPSRAQQRSWKNRLAQNIKSMLDTALVRYPDWWKDRIPGILLPWEGQKECLESKRGSGAQEGVHPWAVSVDALYGQESTRSEIAAILGEHLLNQLPSDTFCSREFFQYAVARGAIAALERYPSRMGREEEERGDRCAKFLEKCVARVDPTLQESWRRWADDMLSAADQCNCDLSDPIRVDKLRLLWSVFPEKPYVPSRSRAI
jgi:hypothetical protein